MPMLGIMASAISGNLWAPAGAYDSISTATVTSGGTATITFSSIPATYTHLQLRIYAQDNRATYAGDSCLITVNGDTAYNYPQHSIQGEGSAASATGTVTSYNALNIRNAMGSSAGPGFAAIVVDFLDYSNTSKNKTMRFLGGHDNNGTVSGYGGYMVLGSSLWLNTAAINSLSLRPETGTLWNQYSSFALYGIK